MTPTWSDLTDIQRRVIAKLTHPDPIEEAVGVEISSFKDELHSEIGWLLLDKLVDVKVGWRDAVWVTLTERGQRIRDEKNA